MDITQKHEEETVSPKNPHVNNNNQIYGNLNEFTLNKNDNDFLAVSEKVSHNFSNLTSQNRNREQFLGLENKLDEMLSGVQNNYDNEKEKVLTITKKYAVYKKIFGDFLKLPFVSNSNDYGRNILEKINDGYNESIQTLMINYTKMHEKVSEYELITNSNTIIIKY